MKPKFMAGVAVGLPDLREDDLRLMRDAGLEWLRTGVAGFDAKLFFQGRAQPEAFDLGREEIRLLKKRGFQILGITPGPKECLDAFGVGPDSEAFCSTYRRMCEFLGRSYAGLIDYWQVANELDIWIFRDRLNLEQSAEFLKAGLRGLKDANANLKVGINITLFPSRPGEVDGNTDKHEGVFLAKSIYQDASLDVDYAGFDSYPGTWREGGAESWNGYLDDLHRLTEKPIIIQEFGYSSAGGLMTEDERQRGAYPCEVKKWKFSWHGAHSPQVQAEFLSESYEIFAQKPFVIGAIYYRWNDQPSCWQCGKPDCPAETAWGLVDLNNQPKPSYFALKKCLLRDDPHVTGGSSANTEALASK